MRDRRTRKWDWPDLEILAKECRDLGIKTHTQYIKRYKEIKRAPRILSRTYPEYNTWYEFIRLGSENERPEKLTELNIYHQEITKENSEMACTKGVYQPKPVSGKPTPPIKP